MVKKVAKDEGEKRSLRSKNDVKETKFDFDREKYMIDVLKPLKVVARKFRNDIELMDQTQSRTSVKDEVHEKFNQISSMTLDIESNELTRPEVVKKRKIEGVVPTSDGWDKLGGNSPGSSRDLKSHYLNNSDPLSDALYKPYHKKMLKQENRMLERDVNEWETEADRLELLSDKLNMLDWHISLPKMTVINDVCDEDEMDRKRELTKEYIRNTLAKYEEMKFQKSLLSKTCKRSRKLDPSKDRSRVYKKVDRKTVEGYHSSSDEEEDGMSVSEIRKHRLDKRIKSCGGVVKIGLTAGAKNKLTIHGALVKLTRNFAIIAEPLRNPYIIKLSLDEKREWNKDSEEYERKLTYYAPFPKQVGEKKGLVVIENSTSDSESDQELEKQPLVIKEGKRTSSIISANSSSNTSSGSNIDSTNYKTSFKELQNCATTNLEDTQITNNSYSEILPSNDKNRIKIENRNKGKVNILTIKRK
ncbi:hypothetical protein Kpol_1024p19 [Vanderwaltozyma polyspora DSM 70294]|uniref:Something about silencing protein 4 domain-containing protein n=1 Tax=Vanderwaltozyma polyspora (strain ATCC 22028 / DSM 70294 / BCRC 21397 / CBS 2163 / NBRC 10782 / NRRL Y-8283 / UCD 57-17) TaxID=436907 RepID=A7TLI0_VANPO|nr:uncharacterized protein Kpol_1024p19 [Vanderwaltozyma polyspora DSM 70294]EDO16866.1 hypothetical protein Kpol_1024p19 [Vanderwaltozyma polyspora DSM 70294]